MSLKRKVALALLSAALLVALCSCGLGGNTPADEETPPASGSPVTQGAVPTSSAAAPDPAEPPEPEESPDAAYLEAFKSVLLNDAEYYDAERRINAKLSEFNLSTEEVKRSVTDFTVVDLDNDGTLEVVLQIAINSTFAFEILHYQDGAVYGYSIPMRAFRDLKTDGTFSFSSSASNTGYGRIEFLEDTYLIDKIAYSESNNESGDEQVVTYTVNHISVTQDELYAAFDKQSSKADSAWFTFNDENVDALLTSSDYKYKENDDGTVTIFQYTGLGGDIVIPSEIDGKRVTAIGHTFELTGAFQDCTTLTSVVIPDGVTEIQDNAFQGCINLISVTIPASVALLRNCAFDSCPNLRSVYFEGDAPEIANYVFTESLSLVFYYKEGTSGWTNPWYSRPTAVTDNTKTASAEAKALTAYLDFIEGNISLSEDDMAEISVQGENPMSNPNGYAVLDMNDDGIPELLINSGNIYILTYKDYDLSLWWSDRFWAGYSLILSNGDILHMRDGAAPTHITYQYLLLNNDGTEKEQIVFAKYDSDEDGIYDHFVFENDDLSEDEWNLKTQPYFSVEEIEWKEDVFK